MPDRTIDDVYQEMQNVMSRPATTGRPHDAQMRDLMSLSIEASYFVCKGIDKTIKGIDSTNKGIDNFRKYVEDYAKTTERVTRSNRRIAILSIGVAIITAIATIVIGVLSLP